MNRKRTKEKIELKEKKIPSKREEKKEKQIQKML